MLNHITSLFFVVTIGSIPGQMMLLFAVSLLQRTPFRSIDARIKKGLFLIGYTLVWMPLIYLLIRQLITAVADRGYIYVAYDGIYSLAYSSSFFLRNEWVMPLALVWFVGACVALYRSRRKLMHFRDKVLLEASPWALHDLPVDVSQLPKRVTRALTALTIVKHPAAQTPLVFGYRKRFLILPDQPLTRQGLHMVLCHEMTHLLHKDLWVKLMAEITRAFFFYNPLFAAASRHLDELCEQACDRVVTAGMSTEEKKDYGRLLLDMLEHAAPASQMTQAALSQDHKQVKNRLQAIIQPLSVSRTRRTFVTLMAAAATLVSLLALTLLLPQTMKWNESRQLFSPSFFESEIGETTAVYGYDSYYDETYPDPESIGTQVQRRPEATTTYVQHSEDMTYQGTMPPYVTEAP